MAKTAMWMAVTEHWSVTRLSHLQSCTLVSSLADPAEPISRRARIVSLVCLLLLRPNSRTPR